MQHSILVSAALKIVVALSFVACSSSGDDPMTTTGTGGAGATGGSSGSGGAGRDGGGGAGGGGTAGSSGTAGSGGSGMAMNCPEKFNYTGYTASTTAYTLTKDIYPIFQEYGCATAGVCHGAVKITPVLGAVAGTPTMMTLEGIRTALLANSVEAPALANVKPGDPENSYMMKKLDNSQNCEGLMCTKHPGAVAQNGCGAVMPLTVTMPIDAAKRKIVRDWIKQGAAL